MKVKQVDSKILQNILYVSNSVVVIFIETITPNTN